MKYCGDCHSGATPEAKLDLTKYGDVAAVLHDRKTWRKVFFKLEAGEMPPQDQARPKPEEIATVTHWIDDQLNRPVPLELQDPGRMTIRRLNRAEYNNTIRDLMAIDFHPADDFPTDEVGEGFDNIGGPALAVADPDGKISGRGGAMRHAGLDGVARIAAADAGRAGVVSRRGWKDQANQSGHEGGPRRRRAFERRVALFLDRAEGRASMICECAPLASKPATSRFACRSSSTVKNSKSMTSRETKNRPERSAIM